jgi:hypothetical protein
VHRAGDEKAWWKQADIDPIKVARKLWKAPAWMRDELSPSPQPCRSTRENGRSGREELSAGLEATARYAHRHRAV